MRATCIMNLKGGVAKTCTAIHMGAILSQEYGKRVLLIDADSQCNLTDFFEADSDVGSLYAAITQADPSVAVCNIQGTGLEGLDILAASDDLMELDLSQLRTGKVYPAVIRDMVAALAANIELCGLQQPIRVREASGRYVIVSGHRRRAACRELGWEEMPCIIDRQTGSPALQELRLIYANSSTRVLSGAELATQAQRVTELLYQLKEEGMEFPGRMRDHVAEAVGISKSKLSRLDVIRKQLHPCMQPLWAADKLSESVAYELAKLTPVRQKAIFLAQTADRTKPFKVYADQIQNIAKEMDRLEVLAEKTTCTEIYTSKCDHVHVRLNQAAKLGQYSGMSCRGCCCTCTWLETCKYSCEHASREKQALKDKKRQENKALKDAKAAEEAPKRELLCESYKRVGTLRAAAGIAPEEFIKTSTGWNIHSQADRLPELESGSKLALTDRLPGGIWPDEAKRLAATADLLGCSIDYLLCHDTPQPKLEGGWYTGTPTSPGWYITRIVYAETGTVTYPLTWWGGKKWADLKDFETVTHWIPEVEE